MNRFKILEWLFQNGNKNLAPERWAALLGVEIIDADGWRGHDFDAECNLATFVERVSRCTINPNA